MIKIINEDGYKTLMTIYKAYQKYKANQQKSASTSKKQSSPKFNSFSASDWNAYPGAQKFSDGSDPVIFKSKYVTIIISGDPSGVWVEMEYHNGKDNYICERIFKKKKDAFMMTNAIASEISRESHLSSDDFIDIVDSFGFELIK